MILLQLCYTHTATADEIASAQAYWQQQGLFLTPENCQPENYPWTLAIDVYYRLAPGKQLTTATLSNWLKTYPAANSFWLPAEVTTLEKTKRKQARTQWPLFRPEHLQQEHLQCVETPLSFAAKRCVQLEGMPQWPVEITGKDPWLVCAPEQAANVHATDTYGRPVGYWCF